MNRARLPIVMALAFGLIGFILWRSSKTEVEEVKLIGFQDTDQPFEMPENGEPDPRFQLLSAWQAHQVPTILRMDPVIGTENGTLSHLSTENTPVHAAADGLVIFSGQLTEDWGKTIVLAHRNTDGTPIQSIYPHLTQTHTTLGKLVSRGDILGHTKPENTSSPYLTLIATEDIPTHTSHTQQLGITALLTTLHDTSAAGISPAPLRFVHLENAQPWTSLEIGNAEKLSELGD